MHITDLYLKNFRNYTEMDFDLPDRVSVFWGDNAQGKSNLLESICFLATTRFSHSVPDREIINWNALKDEVPFGSIRADLKKSDRKTELEIVLTPRSVTSYEASNRAAIHKHIKINGVARRAVDLMGHLNMVMFNPRDIDLISEGPALRRRYLDITNSQIDRHYLRSLQRYNKVLAQRNHLLRHIASGHSHPNELEYWDEELIKNGGYIIQERYNLITALKESADPIHYELSAGKEMLSLEYVDTIDSIEPDGMGDIEAAFRKALALSREKELVRGQSMVGPHRDDICFYINGVNMGSYGSRGQQRTIALSLKLAEAKIMLNRTGETPVVLLDDVLSELDSHRRQHLLLAVEGYEQVLITATDLDHFPPEFLNKTHILRVVEGRIVK